MHSRAETPPLLQIPRLMRVQVKLCQSALALEAAQATDQQLRALFPRLSALPDLISQLRCGGQGWGQGWSFICRLDTAWLRPVGLPLNTLSTSAQGCGACTAPCRPADLTAAQGPPAACQAHGAHHGRPAQPSVRVTRQGEGDCLWT